MSNICKTCDGTGSNSTFENQSPLGSGMVWLEEIKDDCPDCTGSGICARCAYKWDDQTYELYIDFVSGESGSFACPNCNHEYE